MATTIEINGETLHIDEGMKNALETLAGCHPGCIATIHGYVPKTGWVESPVQRINILTRFSLEKFYQRKIAMLETLSFSDVSAALEGEKFEGMSEEEKQELFDKRRNMLMESMNKTLEGERLDAHRQGHDRCYRRVCPGVKVHLRTEKGADGKMHPTMDNNGIPTVDAILVSSIVLNVTTLKEGERKVVNSGAPVLTTKAIESFIGRRFKFRTYSLKVGNFEKVTIGGEQILEESFKELV